MKVSSFMPYLYSFLYSFAGVFVREAFKRRLSKTVHIFLSAFKFKSAIRRIESRSFVTLGKKLVLLFDVRLRTFFGAFVENLAECGELAVQIIKARAVLRINAAALYVQPFLQENEPAE